MKVKKCSHPNRQREKEREKGKTKEKRIRCLGGIKKPDVDKGELH